MIKINSDIYNRSVPLSSLSIGDTFLFNGRVCMLAKRNGHPFVLDLSTGKDCGFFSPSDTTQRVTPIECELFYNFK